jgi:hypothetical protein
MGRVLRRIRSGKTALVYPEETETALKMNGEDRTKIQNIVRRLRAILDELRELEKTSQDTSVKQMAISAALALAWVDLVENFRTKEDNGE